MLDKYLGLDGRMGFTDLLAGSRTLAVFVQVVSTDRFLPQRNNQPAAATPTSESTFKRDLLLRGGRSFAVQPR